MGEATSDDEEEEDEEGGDVPYPAAARVDNAPIVPEKRALKGTTLELNF